MGTTGAIIVYICIWWIVFFSVLPIGIKSQSIEFKDDFQGNDPGAPKNPRIGKKFLITTLITSIIFAVIYYLSINDYLNLRGYLQ
jgi:predicted secreted protein|tara:strand:+ start:1731 stop:1985 length:255 start_codon:yes stop_codon:yes gene_type:complete